MKTSVSAKLVAALVATSVFLATSCVHRTLARNALLPPNSRVERGADDGDKASVESDAEDTLKSQEWFRKRHPDGGLRAKAIAYLDRMSGIAATSGVWTSIGPQPINAYGSTYSGRVWGIAIDPTNYKTIFIGTDGGGVWKSADAGITWVPLTDSQSNINVRDLALAATNPSHIYAATAGGGLLWSTDGGASWTTTYPADNYYIDTVSVHPTNSSFILAATGYAIVRSSDGGNTWATVLSGPQTGQVLFDPSNGGVAYATASDKGIYRSTDSGATWSLLPGAGLPAPPYSTWQGGIDLAVAPSSPNVLYLGLRTYMTDLAIGYYRSTDSGNSWTQVGTPPNETANYWGWSTRVHPSNPNIVFAGSLHLSRSTDGGLTWANYDTNVHVDHHVQIFTPDGNVLYSGNDGGIYSTAAPTAGTASWTSLNDNLSTVMFYPGISISPLNVNLSLGGTQDNGTMMYQGNLKWSLVYGGDGGYTAIDFVNPNNFYAETQNINVVASNDGGSSFHSAESGINSQDRSDFIAPLVIDPSNSQRLYFGTYRLYQTANGASSWTAISGDLTNGSGGINTIAVAPSNPNVVYTGASPAIFVTQNALSGPSASWIQCAGIQGYAVTQIAVSPTNSQVAWITSAGGANKVYQTTDGCRTLTPSGNGLPNVTVDDILIDPDIPGTLYVATDVGVYRSVDNGQSWVPLGSGLPHVIVHALKLHGPTRTLRAATYGRGMWDILVPSTGFVPVTIQSMIPGRYFSLEDGTTFQSPISFYWLAGAQHTITWLTSVPGVPGTRQTFGGWTDGNNQNPRTLVVPSSGASYTASVGAQYLLTLIASPSSGGTVTGTPSSSDGFYDAGTSVQIEDVPATGYGFWYLSGDLSGNLPQSISMNSPHSVTANFYCSFQYSYLPYSTFGPAASSGYFQIQTGAGCSWNVGSNVNWFTVLGPAAGQGTAVVGYSVSANSGANRTATLSITGSSYSYSPSFGQDAAGTNRPSIVSVNPASGTGTGQTFSFLFQDPGGYAKLTQGSLAFSPPNYSTPTCSIYFFSNPAYLYLINDAGTQYLGPISLPGTGTLQNSQCIIDASKSSVAGSGTNLTVSVAMTFKPGYAGARLINAYAYDSSSNLYSVTEMVGTYGVTGIPSSVSVTPGSGVGASQAFSFTYSDLAGASDIATASALINSGLSGPGSCDLQIDTVQNVVWLLNDAASAWLGPVALGAAGTVQNSQCVVNGGASGKIVAGNILTITVALNFQTGFAGAKTIYANAFSAGGQSAGWLAMGTWTVPGNQPPSVLSVTPSAGSGASQTFSILYSDPYSAADLASVQALFNGALSGPGSCDMQIDLVHNYIWLLNDSATAWVGPVTLGAASTTQNSQCTVNGIGSTKVASGNSLTANVALNFHSNFTGTKAIFANATNISGQSSGWYSLGTWTVPGNLPPSAVSVAPSSGSGASQTFSFVYSDPYGAADLTSVQALVNTSLSGPGSCDLQIDLAHSYIWLLNDTASAWLGPATLGASGAIQNSQCNVSGAGSGIVASGSSVTVNLALNFHPGFAGTKTVYSNATSAGGQPAGWTTVGSWAVPGNQPSVVSVNPSSGNGASQTFSFVYSDPYGASDLTSAFALVSATLSGPSSCDLQIDTVHNLAWLLNDGASAWLGPVSFGMAGTVQNSQCSVNGGTSSKVSSGTNLTVNLAINFSGAFSGVKTIYGNATNTGGQLSGWRSLGTWTVPANQAPSTASVTPSSGTGASQTFTFVYSDPNGASDLTAVFALMNSSLSGPGSCDLQIDPIHGYIWLLNDSASGWLGPVAFGVTGAAQNSQCIVSGIGSSKSYSAANLAVSLALSFQVGFAGMKNVYGNATDAGGLVSGWSALGTWTPH